MTWKNKTFILGWIAYGLIFFFFVYGIGFGMPIETIPDETAQLKNIYAMLNAKSPVLQYPSSYSVWTHYTYIIPTVIYWVGYYLFADIPNLAELKFYILNNYQEVLPFLRFFTASLFFVGLLLVKKVIEESFNKEQAWFFFLFVGMNLLVVINVHQSKHWMADYGLMMIGLYCYWNWLKERGWLRLLSSFFIFSVSVLSTPAFIVYGVYFLLLHYHRTGSMKDVAKYAVAFVVFLFGMAAVTHLFLGSGGAVGGRNILAKMFSGFYFDDAMRVFWEFSPMVLLMFIGAFTYMREKKYYILLLPFIGWLILLHIAFSHFEPRYALIFMIEGSLIATFFAKFLWDKHRKIFFGTATLFILYNGLSVVGWLHVIGAKDTRVEAREWLETNAKPDDFIIYNVLGFNYLPLTDKTVSFLENHFPNALGTREKLHRQYHLHSGKNGLLLWKLVDADYQVDAVVDALKHEGYDILFVNEHFGHVNGINIFNQPHDKALQKFLESYDHHVVKRIEPFRTEPADREMIGDVLYNFANPLYTLWHLERSGPVVTIFEVKQESIKKVTLGKK